MGLRRNGEVSPVGEVLYKDTREADCSYEPFVTPSPLPVSGIILHERLREVLQVTLKKYEKLGMVRV
jgi:hypothetical protein